MRVPWLGDVLTDAGLTVVKVGNPVGRGREMETVYGVVGHDTVTTRDWTDERVDELLRVGRSDLPGPLAQLGLDRQGRFRWVADGRSNHNGHGVWGNNAIGIEVYCAGGLKGREEKWNTRQYESFVTGTAAILDHLNLGRSSKWNPRVAGHKETDPSRKIDPWGIDMNRVRRDVAAHRSEDPMADHQHSVNPSSLPRGWADTSWKTWVEASGTDPKSRTWEFYREDLSWVYERVIRPLEARCAALEKRVAALESGGTSGGLTKSQADKLYVPRGSTVTLP